MNFKLTALLLSATLALTACGGEKPAETTSADNAPAASDSIKARQDLMQDWRGANDIIKGMLENPASFDAAVLQEQTKFLSESTAHAWTHFADPNQKGKSQDAVWADAAGFKAAADKFDTAVSALHTAAQTAKAASDIEAAFGQVGESCGSCHKVFKQK